MVLELKVPQGADWDSLRPLTPVFLTYVLSFLFLGTYWNNHHHMLHTVDRITGRWRSPISGSRTASTSSWRSFSVRFAAWHHLQEVLHALHAVQVADRLLGR